jgi:hypothetical protein
MAMAHETLNQFITGLSEDVAFQVIDFAEYLAAKEAQEDADDIAYIEAHKNEESIALEDALKELGV